jgi:uncharacterized repeat protein (TIGR01451 family)
MPVRRWQTFLVMRARAAYESARRVSAARLIADRGGSPPVPSRALRGAFVFPLTPVRGCIPMHHHRATLVAALAAGLLAVPAGAQQAKSAAPSLTVAAVNTTAEQAGETSRKTVKPDDVLRYTLTFSNPGPKALGNVELRNPIPKGVHFVPGSAHASRDDARLEFSADGGKSWSAQPMETVTVDGQPARRAVPVERYTHVRWIVGGTVAANSTVTADFSAKVVGAER